MIAVVVGCSGSTRIGGAPPQGSTHDHVVVVQVGEGGQAGRPVGDGRPPAI